MLPCIVDFESVRKGIEEVKSLYEKVNVVACNAGVMALEVRDKYTNTLISKRDVMSKWYL